MNEAVKMWTEIHYQEFRIKVQKHCLSDNSLLKEILGIFYTPKTLDLRFSEIDYSIPASCISRNMSP